MAGNQGKASARAYNDQRLSLFSGICQHCAEKVSIVVNGDELASKCTGCGKDPFKVKRFKGMVYIVSNPNYPGMLKVGLTTRDLDSRMIGLGGTGVPGRYGPVAMFPSNRPEEHERKAHEKLRKCRFDKEHFAIGEVDAILAVYRALGRKTQPIIYSAKHREAFPQQLAMDKQIMDQKVGRAPATSEDPTDGEYS